MKSRQISERLRPLAVLATLLTASCVFQQDPANPLIGSWTTADRNKVTFAADAVVVTPDKEQPMTLGPRDCNGVYKLQYGRMDTAALERSFPAQADLQAKLKQLLVKPEYPVVDVTCDRGGTTYLMLDDRQMLAVYRDSGVGGLETYSRL
jgi:hypothetical protein